MGQVHGSLVTEISIRSISRRKARKVSHARAPSPEALINTSNVGAGKRHWLLSYAARRGEAPFTARQPMRSLDANKTLQETLAGVCT